jgi:hypothetical protein
MSRVALVSRRRWITYITVAVVLAQGLSLVATRHSSPASADASTGAGGEFIPVQGRILDTRAAYSIGGYTTPMTANAWRTVAVEGDLSGAIPSSGVSAVAVNFTILDESVTGTLHADTDETPANATVSYVAYNGSGGAQSDSGVVAVADDGNIQVETTSTADLIIDVEGYYTSDPDVAPGGYVPLAPTRIVDTRNGTGLPLAMLAAGSTSTIQVRDAEHSGA